MATYPQELEEAFKRYQAISDVPVDTIGKPIEVAGTHIYPLWYIDQASYVNGAMFSD